jgi:hypothetical protein
MKQDSYDITKQYENMKVIQWSKGKPSTTGAGRISICRQKN